MENATCQGITCPTAPAARPIDSAASPLRPFPHRCHLPGSARLCPCRHRARRSHAAPRRESASRRVSSVSEAGERLGSREGVQAAVAHRSAPACPSGLCDRAEASSGQRKITEIRRSSAGVASKNEKLKRGTA
ncbi:hypothetical protein PsYK624_142540 [Phanerochaete sordida]|uniref:Uncharacterized protein n=1 Tax=Phanerochaete sordida TaxID=48140 RepID=A0A9P3GM99_9APHY|nr:hypothetical protein PsYK624_142540 [Phanerochaete sordida]